MKSVLRFPPAAISLMLCCTAQANDHKLLGAIAMPRNETNDLALKLPVCRIVKRIQLSADHGDLQLSGASVYFKAARSASQSLNIPSEIKKGKPLTGSTLTAITTINAASQKNHLFGSYGELIGYGHAENYRRRLTPEYRSHKKMNVNYLNDSDLDFLQHCSEEQLANFARLLTHNEKAKLASPAY